MQLSLVVVVTALISSGTARLDQQRIQAQDYGRFQDVTPKGRQEEPLTTGLQSSVARTTCP